MKFGIKFSILAVFAFVAATTIQAFSTDIYMERNHSTLECDDAQTVVLYDFESCDSELGIGNISYAEFEPSYPTNLGCSDFTAGNVFRVNPLVNGHSCVEGNEDGTMAMCVAPVEDCNYDPGNERSVLFEVSITPGSEGVATLGSLEFMEQSPSRFSWINGSSGINNYPRYFAVRVLANNEEIFLQEDILTEGVWNNNVFNFSSLEGFTVFEPTTFQFELQAYCQVNNGSTISVWDVDQIQIKSCCVTCDHVEAGTIATSSDTEICTGANQSAPVVTTIAGNVGDHTSWVITDVLGNILTVQDESSFDFESYPSGTCQIRAITFDHGLQGLEVNANVSNLVGCYEFSNALEITKHEVNGGSISTDQGSIFRVCSGDEIPDIVEFNLSGNDGLSTWIIMNNLDQIVELPQGPPFNFEGEGPASCFVIHMSHDDEVGPISIGQNINSITGCVDFSNKVTIIKDVVNGGVITPGEADICRVNGGSNALDFEVTGTKGRRSTWIITDLGNTIISLPGNPPFNFSGFPAGSYKVWHVSHNEDYVITVGDNLNGIDGCFDLAEHVPLSICELTSGEITTNDPTEICVGDGQDDVVNINILGNSGGLSSLVITDISGNILALPTDPSIDFERVGGGICVIYNVTFKDGLEGLEVGSNIVDLDGCYVFSNKIQVDRTDVDAGNINTQDPTFFCLGDATDDIINIDQIGNTGPNGTFLITNSDSIVSIYPSTPMLDLAGTGSGTFQIWYLTYDQLDTNLIEGLDLSDLDGCYDLSNSITITTRITEGGIIRALDRTEVCSGDGNADLIDFTLTNSVGTVSSWIITDEDGLILDVPSSPPFDFEGAGAGVCLVWHISHEPDLIGLSPGENANDLSGCFDLSNSVRIVRDELAAGFISTADVTTVCTGDALMDLVDVNLQNNSADNGAWVITDDAGNIIELPTAPPFDFNNAPSGVCFIYHLSYQDGLNGFTLGNNISELSGCYAFSNGIEITRMQVDGGSISTDDPTTICTGNGVNDIVNVSLSANVGSQSQWIVTDENRVILELSSDSTFNFEAAGAGVCLIWHMSYENGVSGLAPGTLLDNLDGCFNLSNSIEVTRNQVTGGTIATTDPTVICTGNGIDDLVDVSITGNEGSNSQWIIADETGMILELPNSSSFNFEGVPSGVCLILHISYEDISGLEVGALASQVQGCFSFSNSIRIERTEVSSGTISTTDPLSICTGDGVDDIIDVNLQGNVGSSSQWLITDQSGIIIETPAAPPFNFEGAGSGICLIWHLASDGAITGAQIGENANDIEGCFELSNALSVERTEINGGNLTTNDLLVICSGDGFDDLINPILVDNIGANQQWVITDESGVILDLPANAPFDFEGAGVGVCLIWNLSYDDGLSGLEVGNDVAELTGCYAFSNELRVVRDEVMAGEISTNDETNVCVGGGQLNLVNVSITGQVGANFAWVITDETGVILDLPLSSPFDFTNVTAGLCRIFAISYSTGLIGLEVGSALNNLQGCFAISNGIPIVRDEMIGGVISTTDPLSVCVGDGVADLIDVSLSGEVAIFSNWLITNEFGIILDTPVSPPFDFEPAGPGTCLIWHLSTRNGLASVDALVGDNINMMSGCFSLSNPLTVVRTEIEGGVITTNNETDICVGDGASDFIDVTVSAHSGTNSGWIITDENLDILALPLVPPFDLEGAGPGTCLIWHVSYESNLSGLLVGANAADLSGCFALSNSITVNREEVNGGTIESDGRTELNLCVADCLEDTVNVTIVNNVGAQQFWVITDVAGNIIALPTGPPFDFEGSGEGTCLIWHLSASSDFSAPVLGENINDYDGCFHLSNPIVVNRFMVEGNGESTACFDMNACNANVAAGENGNYSEFTAVINNLDDCATISIVGDHLYRRNPTTNIHSCTPGPDGSAALCIMPQEACVFVNDSDFALRFSVEVIPGISGTAQLSNLSFLQSGPETFEWIDGREGINNYPSLFGVRILQNGVELFKETAIPTSLLYNQESFDLSSITDFFISAPTVFDVEILPYCIQDMGGVESVWDIEDLKISSSCSNKLEGGELIFGVGSKRVELCVDDGIEDTIEFTTSSMSNNYQYVFTDLNDVIVGIPTGNTFNFEGLDAGECRIWGVAYSGNFIAQIGDQVGVDLLASECFNLSDNFLRVIRLTGPDCPASIASVPIAVEYMLSPNPAQDELKITFMKMPSSDITLTVHDVYGNLIMTKQMDVKEEEYYMLDIKSLITGNYIVKIKSANFKEVQKFSKIN